jgi:3-deoxy-D-manno-octulosonic-acid transferase
VIVGPHTWNFTQVAEDAVAVGAALRVIDADSLVHEVRRLLGDDAACRRMGSAGLAFCSSHRGAVAKTIALCERLLPV